MIVTTPASAIFVKGVNGVTDGTLKEVLLEMANGRHYRHDQMVPSASWVITHGLGRVPAISVIDSAGDLVVGDVSVIGLDVVQIDFSGPFSGTAYCA